MQTQPLPSLALRSCRTLLSGFSQIFLQNDPGCGLLILLGIAVGAPELLGGALLGGLSSMLTAKYRGYASADIEQGLYGYNGVLLGMLISMQFQWSVTVPLLIMLSAGLSSLMLAPWMARMRNRQWLPAFTFPFVVLSWLLLELATPLQLQLQLRPSAAVESQQLDLINSLAAMARGLGQVLFIERPLSGLCLLLGLFVADTRAAVWGLIGSACGLGFALYQGWEQHSALAGVYGYNAVLAAIAVSQVNRRIWLPLLAIILALGLQPGFSSLGLPALTMPFILACWLISASQRLIKQSAAQTAPRKAKP
ncbi:urea transporter [Pseudomonas sp. M30-35]|uniref:urea transporter n=1 Tax=Pseudomonas sp. M30-35 TaxID=1981174 RepID=UPI000B3CCF61|nr:urea transporter [Pseudomonas sp. M30-35]ARU88996.1 urea transporter [Pseudomonas sp. M30-35]